MSYIGLIITYILGISIYVNVSSKSKLIASLGYGFILGIGVQTFIMLLLDFVGIKIGTTSVFSISLVFSLIFFILHFKKLNKSSFSKDSILRFLDLEKIKSLNFVWLFASGLIIYLVYSISQKTMFWPTNTSDSLSSFDVFAKAIAHEGKIFNSLIHEKRVGYGAAYPPLYSLSLAYAYQIGFESAKIIPTLFFVSLPMCFYSSIKEISTNTLAICTTLIAIATPELLAQSAINITNVPQAIYGSLAALNLIVFLRKKDFKFLLLAGILAALNGFIRSEGIIYIGACMLVLFTFFIQKKTSLKDLIIFSVIALTPFVLWQLNLKINSDLMEKYVQVSIRPVPYFNMDQINEISKYAWLTISSTQMYGITLYVLLIALILNIKFIIKEKNNLSLLFILLTSFFGYLILVNQMILKADSFLNIIRYSGKRYFFGPILLAWMYIATNKMSINIFSKIENWLSFDDKK